MAENQRLKISQDQEQSIANNQFSQYKKETSGSPVIIGLVFIALVLIIAVLAVDKVMSKDDLNTSLLANNLKELSQQQKDRSKSVLQQFIKTNRLNEYSKTHVVEIIKEQFAKLNNQQNKNTELLKTQIGKKSMTTTPVNKTSILKITPMVPFNQEEFVPTVGIPSKDKPFNYTVVTRENMKEYELGLAELFKPYNNTDCQYKRYGHPNDGGYVTCKNMFNKTQAILNFGIQRRDNFGCDISKQFDIPNYQFDCYFQKGDKCNPNAKFFSKCSSDEDKFEQGRQFVTMSTILEKLKLKQKHVMLKIDIQSDQWPTLKAVPISQLPYIDHIVMQVHYYWAKNFRKPLWGNLEIIRQLKEHFVSVNLHMTSNGCYNLLPDKTQQSYHHFHSYAVEVSLVNKNLIKKHSNQRSYKLHKLNAINFLNFPNCLMPEQ